MQWPAGYFHDFGDSPTRSHLTFLSRTNANVTTDLHTKRKMEEIRLAHLWPNSHD